MKKMFIILILICMLTTLSSCDAFMFERAFAKLSEESFTMEGAMRVDLSMSYMGQTVEQTVVVDLVIQSSPTEVYTESKSNGSVQKSYVKIDNELEQVLVYSNDGSTWTKETKTLEEYQAESDSYFLDIEVKDVFTLEDGVWIGNTETITSMLEKYIDELGSSLVGTGATLESFDVEKYNIEMSGSDISKVDIIMNMIMSASGIPVTIRMSMPMEVKNVGSTIVTVPEGLPE